MPQPPYWPAQSDSRPNRSRKPAVGVAKRYRPTQRAKIIDVSDEPGRVPTVEWIDVDDGLVAFVPATSRFVDLNESAAEMWHVLCRSGGSEPALVEHLVTAHALDPDTAREIDAHFIDDLRREGLPLPD